jgi:diguanylate cyclase (GGDEF)-like protein
MSLRTRIVLLVLLAIFTPATLLIHYLFRNRDSDVADAKQSLHVLAAYAVKDLGDKISGTVQLLHGLSRAADLETVDKETCSAFLGDVLERYPQYTGLLTILPDGHLRCDSLRSSRTLDLNDRAYFKQARASAEPAFEAVFGRLTGIAVLQVAFPARDNRGGLKYVLLASLNLAQASAHYATASLYQSMEVVIWDSKGTVMARHPDDGPRKLAGSSQADSVLYRFVRMKQTGDTAELAGPDGIVKLWAVSALPSPAGTGLRVAVGVSPHILLAKADQDLRESMSILGIGSLVAFAGALLFAELGIRRHVARVITAAERQRAGDSGARIGAPYPHGELGGLMATLDAAAASVQAQQMKIESDSEELRRANRTLRVLSAINSAIVRVHDRDELLAESCRIAAEEGHFPIVWAGLLDREAMQVKPVAWQGVDEAHLRSIPRGVTDLKSLVGSVIREKRAMIVDDAVGLPLIVSGEATGVFVLHSRAAGFFDEREMKLLNEFAGEIAFALEYIEKSDKLEYLAYYDALTGLANRGLFLERVAQHLRSAASGGHKLGLFMIDLERFRNINDTLGRPAGDALLKQVAEWLARDSGDVNLVARVGSDHFAVVLPEVLPAHGARSLEKSMAAFLEHPFRLNGAVFRIAVKIGVATFPEDGADADTLFRNAEAALKKAKASGERYVFYTRAMNERIAEKLSLENQLRQALDKGEFVLHYQPKVNLSSGQVTSAEALIRWNDPRTGLVPPGRFIPILEETGLIYDVGRWALHQAVEDFLRWRNAGLAAVRIAVNVSPLQLRNRGFLDEVKQAISIDAHAAAGLELEITESLIMEDVRSSMASLHAIRALGVTIAIDDFGTGFSSLSYLAKLPVDTLKIDRSFVIDMTAGPQGLGLVSTIINLAHSLKLTVVAEGVETEEQKRLLHLLGCDEMQGYLFSKPVPAEVFEATFLARPAAG